MRFGRKNPSHDFDASAVDLVAESADGTVELVIVRDVPWTGSDSELMSLQQKVHNYVGYAVDGQMATQYPEVVGRPWAIVVASTDSAGDPDPRTQSVLDTLSERLPAHGGELRTRRV